jgi:hypothetical protein
MTSLPPLRVYNWEEEYLKDPHYEIMNRAMLKMTRLFPHLQQQIEQGTSTTTTSTTSNGTIKRETAVEPVEVPVQQYVTESPMDEEVDEPFPYCSDEEVVQV